MGTMRLDAAQGIGGMLKEGTTLADGVDEAVLKNIGAAKQLAEIVKTSLGPHGRKKLIVNHLGKTLVSSDCGTIVRELEVVHPAAQMIALAAKAQEQESGDGTNFVVSLAGSLLGQAEELLRQGLHTSEVVKGYEMAYKEAMAIIPTLSKKEAGDPRDEAAMAHVAKFVVGSKHEGLEDVLSELVGKACVDVMEPAPGPAYFKADQVRVAKIKGGDARTHSLVVKGMVVMRDTETSVKSAKDAKVAVFGCGIEMAQTETKGTVLIKSAEELLQYNKTEERALETIVKEIYESGIKVVVCNGSISEMARHFLEKYKLLAIRIPSKFDMRRICKATGASTMVRLGAPTPEEHGFISKIQVQEIGGKTCTVFDQDKTHSSKISTIVLRASTTSLLDDLERAVDNGIQTIRNVAKDPRLVAGAGAFEAALAAKLRAFGETNNGLEQYAIQKFADSFECVPRALAENAGLDATKILADLRATHADGFSDAGVVVDYDDDDHPVVDSSEKRRDNPVVDSLAVKESAIRLAVDSALTVLRVDQIIMSKAAGGPKPPPQGPPDA